MSLNTENEPRYSQPNAVDEIINSHPPQDEYASQAEGVSSAAGDRDDSDDEFETSQNRRRTRWILPTILLVLTVFSMTWAGTVAWSPGTVLAKSYEDGTLFWVRRNILLNWFPGLLFSVSLAAILGAHELGHYFVTRWYRIQSTLPLFIPFPINPIGTCGAVILMDGSRADRRQIFDIGIAGPIAGLVIAIPVAAIGMQYGTPPQVPSASILFGQPLLIQLLEWIFATTPIGSVGGITNAEMNPLLMAAWVGLLVTGLNMMPIGQLDGGHVIYGLLGKSSRWINWFAYSGAIAYVIYAAVMRGQPEFLPMVLLIPLMGITHPPTFNDQVPMGASRIIAGTLSLVIPILCIPMHPFVLLN